MVTIDDVKKVAKLAKLEFTEPELESLTGELNGVLSYIDQLSELDLRGVEPLENLNESVESSAMRPDANEPSLPREEALKNAPMAADGYFLVPKVLDVEVRAYAAQDISGDEEEELL